MKNATKERLILLGSFFISLLLASIIMPLRGGYVSIGKLTGIPLANLVYMICFFILPILLLKKKHGVPKHKVLITILLGSIALDLPVHLWHWNESLISFLDVPCRLIAILVGYWYNQLTDASLKRIILLCIYGTLSLWLALVGVPMWMDKTFSQKDHQVTVTNRCEEPIENTKP